MNRIQPESDLTDPLPPGLYIVATPIGNLGDITLRAIDVLRRCDRIACEDTRVTGKLLKHLEISRPMLRYDDHASGETQAKIIDLARKQAVALLSDAGTPLISDPGFRLVKGAREAGVNVTSLPGPCALIAGLTMSGLPNDRFLFAGFLPAKDKARRDLMGELGDLDATLIFYDTGPRLSKSLAAMAEIFPDRQVAVAREITKLHEECRQAPAAQLLEHYSANPPKGEIVLMVGPPLQAAYSGDADRLLEDALEVMKPSQAAAQVARVTGLDRKMLYSRAMELKPS